MKKLILALAIALSTSLYAQVQPGPVLWSSRSYNSAGAGGSFLTSNIKEVITNGGLRLKVPGGKYISEHTGAKIDSSVSGIWPLGDTLKIGRLELYGSPNWWEVFISTRGDSSTIKMNTNLWLSSSVNGTPSNTAFHNDKTWEMNANASNYVTGLDLIQYLDLNSYQFSGQYHGMKIENHIRDTGTFTGASYGWRNEMYQGTPDTLAGTWYGVYQRILGWPNSGKISGDYYAFYSDLEITGVGNSMYHFYGEQDYPSYFGGKVDITTSAGSQAGNNARLAVEEIVTDNSGGYGQRGIFNVLKVQQGSNDIAQRLWGYQSIVNGFDNNSGDFTAADSLLGNLIGSETKFVYNGEGRLPVGIGLHVEVIASESTTAGGSIGTLYGIRLRNLYSAAHDMPITNGYGIFLEEMLGTNVGTYYHFYADGDHPSYFGGDIQVDGELSAGALTPVTDATTDFAANFTGTNLYGGTFVCDTDDGDLQLPAVAEGMNFTIITLGAIQIVAEPNASDNIILDGVQLDDADSATNLSTAGDIIVFQYYSAAGWLATSNGWTDED